MSAAFRHTLLLSSSVEAQHLFRKHFTLGSSRVFLSQPSVLNSVSHNTLNMDGGSLLPPAAVRGMMELDRVAFERKILVPHVVVDGRRMDSILKKLKKYLLKLQKLKPVKIYDDDPEKKEILVNPSLMRSSEDIRNHLGEAGEEVTCVYREVTVGYDNWKAEDILKAVLPTNQEGGLSYSIVGHILHLNLRDHILPYKSLIGQVYLDKVPGISVVINKLNTIDSTYRNFQMEVLGGSGETVVTVKENGSTYTMDFARVYWNPRLSTEHGRIVGQLQHGDVLYDVMAGVGPFAIPAARKKCYVLVNDLNPDSFDALLKNCARNKLQERVRCFNMDGHDFITTTLKTDLLARWNDPDFVGSLHVTMNLPAMAVTFLPSFQGLLHGTEIQDGVQLPLVHVYMFTKDTQENAAIQQVAENLGYSLKASGGELLQEDIHDNSDSKSKSKSRSDKDYASLKMHVQEVVHVRDVAPNKAMMRVSFKLPLEVLLEEPQESPCKKFKAS